MRFSECVDFTGTAVSSFDGLKTYVSTGALDCDHIDFDKVEEVSFADKPSRANVSVQKGDVLFAKMMATKKTLRIDDENKDFIYSTGFCAVRPKRDVMSSETLYRLLTSDFFLQKKDLKCSGATQKAATNTELGKIEINVPSLNEQNELEIKFEQLDNLIAKRNSQLNKLETLSSALFYEMFGDLIQNNKGWETKCLNDLGDLGRGVSKHRPRNAPELLGGTMPLIQTGDVANANFQIKNYSSTYSDFGVAQSKVWPKGTLCITIAANIGKCAILNFEACFPDSIVGFTVNKLIEKTYIYFVFKNLQKLLESKAPGAAQKNINLEILKKVQIPVPPLPLQQSFANKIDRIENQKELVRNSIKKLKLLKNALMQQYFA